VGALCRITIPLALRKTAAERGTKTNAKATA
jgi:hypothetical protein